jgi:hypothetical protein
MNAARGLLHLVSQESTLSPVLTPDCGFTHFSIDCHVERDGGVGDVCDTRCNITFCSWRKVQ